jgi:hypothetical protein
MDAIDYLNSRLRAADEAKARWGWMGREDFRWLWPSWRHVRFPYDRERER